MTPTDTKWLIWSIEHQAYWSPNSHGYTISRDSAGRYGYDEAADICYKANRHLRDTTAPFETMIPDV